MNARLRNRIAIASLFATGLAGIAARLYSAWCFRHNLTLDAGVVALMSKHISEGKEWPIFFYGQPHMGSLEATLGGWICRYFGYHGFLVNLGTAIVAMGLLPITYFWAKGAAGRTAGSCALAFIAIGPGGFFHYNGSPRGGYAAALTFGSLVLWLSTYMVIRWKQDRQQCGWHYLFLGIGAGLAWWSSQLTTAAILSAALLLLIGLRQQVITWRLIAGIFGFLAGSAPFWYYNLIHDWASFTLGGSLGRTHYLSSLQLFFADRFALLMVPAAIPEWWQMLVLGAYFLLFMCALALLVRHSRPFRHFHQISKDVSIHWTLVGILLFTLVFAAIFAGSHFSTIDTPRYFLPMVPGIAVVLGISTATLRRIRLMRPVAFVPLAVLVLAQVPTLRWGYEFAGQEAARQRQLEALGRQLRDQHIEAVYAPIHYRAWNAALREEIAVSDVMGDFYTGISRAAEQANHAVVLENYSSAYEFAIHSGGSARRATRAGFALVEEIQPPAEAWRPIDRQRIRRVVDLDGRDLTDAVTDGRITTHWAYPVDEGSTTLTIEFVEPLQVSGMRLAALSHMTFPLTWTLEGQCPDKGWHMIYERQPYSGYHWSGPRFYWGPPYPRLDIRFAPRTLSALRIHHINTRPDNLLRIYHVQLYEPDGMAPDWELGLHDLMLALEQHGIRHLYADRWVANRIRDIASGRIQTTQRSDWYEESLLSERHRVRFSAGIGLLVEHAETELLRQRLQSREINFQVQPAGPWSLFYDFDEHDADEVGLYWAGFTAFLNDSARDTALRRKARASHSKQDPYFQALSFYHPEDPTALMEPEHRVEARFDRNIRLIGYTIENSVLVPGKPLYMILFWEISSDLDPSHLRVFVHFMTDGIVFQGDHGLLGSLSPFIWQEQPDVALVAERRIILVPADLNATDVGIRMGIVRRRDGSRLSVQTDLPTRRQAITLPSRHAVAVN